MTMASSLPTEQTPLLQLSTTTPTEANSQCSPSSSSQAGGCDRRRWRRRLWRLWERLMIALILINVVAFILSSGYVEAFVGTDRAARCSDTCDRLWFGNHVHSSTSSSSSSSNLHVYASTSILEVISIVLFTVDYACLFWTATDVDAVTGRLRFLVSFFSLVDLAAIVPFYLDVLFMSMMGGGTGGGSGSVLQHRHVLTKTSWIRMLRLVRIMNYRLPDDDHYPNNDPNNVGQQQLGTMIHHPGRRRRRHYRYDTALALLRSVFASQKGILGTALFVGLTVWLSVSSLYYLVERHNVAMIYCPTCDDNNEGGDANNIDTSLCSIDEWGFVNCTAAGCTTTTTGSRSSRSNTGSDPSSQHIHNYPCCNLYESIVMASYYALLNLFGEYPLLQQHSPAGQVVGTCTAVVAVAVFALPTGIIANGFESVLLLARAAGGTTTTASSSEEEEEEKNQAAAVNAIHKDMYGKDAITTTAAVMMRNDQQLETASHLQSSPSAQYFDHFTHVCTAAVFLTFVVQTTMSTAQEMTTWMALLMDGINLIATLVFAMDYALKVYSSTGASHNNDHHRYDDSYRYRQAFQYALQVMPLLDLLTFVPYLASVLRMRGGGGAAGAAALFPLTALHHHSAAEESTKQAAAAAAPPPHMNMNTLNWIAALRLFRILRWERYTRVLKTASSSPLSSSPSPPPSSSSVQESSLVQSQAISQPQPQPPFQSHHSRDVLTLTAVSAAMLWVLFGIILYFTERNNPDPEMARNYSTIPNAMWITLLNLSGESPLCQYSVPGKIATGILGLFATAVFGIPIGVLGASFEQVVSDQGDDTTELEISAQEALEAAAATTTTTTTTHNSFLSSAAAWLSSSGEGNHGSSFERWAFQFVNGQSGPVSKAFELLIYCLIVFVVVIGIVQTVHGHENDLYQVEAIAVAIFTAEYVLRLIGSGSDPEFSRRNDSGGGGSSSWTRMHCIICARLRYMMSFYSVIDLLAIVPYYLALALPNSLVDQYDEYLRMFRILRLAKLDKYVPSISLLDNVIRLKFNSLKVAFFAALTLWVLFAAFLFLTEYKDNVNELEDAVPLYGCDEDCTMKDRFQNYFDSLYYTGIHLTGDYPIITYSWPARVVCLFMVLAAVGVVSIPSGLIASGFVQIVQSRQKALLQRGNNAGGSSNDEAAAAADLGVGVVAGDDWYELRYRSLDQVAPPPSRFGPRVDAMQNAVNEFLNGKQGEGLTKGHKVWGRWARAFRVFLFVVIISNIVAVIAESIPSVDYAVGNDPGNFFDVFEAASVMVFALEYILRLFCAPKNRESLYSSWIYATTFFGIVDFLSTAPWFVQQALIATGHVDFATGDNAKIFRILRMFRILQLEDFCVAFSKLDNVFRASKDVLKATGLLAIIIWVGGGALFYVFESNNPNWRTCEDSIPLRGTPESSPGCFDFVSTEACNEYYSPGSCQQVSFTNLPNALFYTAVFLGGEWGVVDFTWSGRVVCLFLCVVGIALYAIPIGTLFDSFGAILGLLDDDDEEEEGEGDDEGRE